MRTLHPAITRLFSLMLLLCVSVAAGAETRIRTVTETTTTSSWYMSPWVWIGGAIIAILMLSVLLGSGRRPSDSDY